MLYKSCVEYANYSLNHVEGCSHGCTYPCYAMMMKKRYGVIKSYQDWTEPKIVSNTLELLDKELPKLKSKINKVFLCFTTDPFMYQVLEVEQLTLKILKRLNEDKIKAVLISKGVYPNALTDRAVYNEQNEYGITVVFSSDDYRRRFEPQAAPLDLRVQALKMLHDAGLKTWVSMEPYPTPNIVKQDIREILRKISFVDRIVFGKWNYNKSTSQFLHYKNFYNSMAYEVASFCEQRKIECHIKKGSINMDLIPDNRLLERTLLTCYL